MNLIEYPDRDLLMLDLADRLASELADSLRRNESATFSVPGGTTPGPVFDVISEQKLDWGRTFVVLNDERWAPEGQLEALAEGLVPHLPISVLLLGMGTDMHTASLFPGADNLAAALDDDAPPLMAMRADAAGEARVTLTAPVLKGALSTHVLITGSEKRKAIERAAKLKPVDAPIACVLGQATVHWAE